MKRPSGLRVVLEDAKLAFVEIYRADFSENL
jgi:hypothetical protein